MSLTNIQSIFENENEVKARLSKINVKKDQNILKEIFNFATKDTISAEKYGLVFLEYFLSESIALDSKTKLTYINTYFREDIITTNIRRLIFEYSFMVRDTKQDQEDIELYRLLYSVLNQTCKKVCTIDSMRRHVDNSITEKKKQKSKEYDDIIENYMRNPAIYPPKLENLDTDTMSKFALFNILYDSSLRPIQFDGMDDFKFSDKWTSILQYVKKSHHKVVFEIDTQFAENGLKGTAEKMMDRKDRESAYTPTDLGSHSAFTFTSKEELETVFKEAIQSLKVAHPRYMVTITFALNLLNDSIKLNRESTSDVSNYLEKMCEATWLGLYQSLLTNMAFEIEPYSTSYTFKKLTRVAACYYKYSLRSEHDFPVSIWDNYYLQRTTFLNLINDDLPADYNNISLIERIVFTSAL